MRQKQLLEEARLLREARKQVFLSYGQKLLLVVIACVAFTALQWLGKQKEAEKEAHKTRWKGRPEIVKAVVQQAKLEAAASSAPNLPNPKPAGKPPLVGTTTQKAADKPVAAESPCPNVLDLSDSFFASREQMTAAMQDLAEACVWASFRRTIKNATQKLEAAGENPEAEKFTHFADYIAKEEALATVTAKVARQHVAARLVAMPLAPEPRKPFKAVAGQSTWKNVTARLGDKIQQAADEDSSLYVFYEMLWYAALLTGVIASSILFMVLLHALPLTDSEGYWTTRISEILKSIPARNVIAIPLAAAAIGGGALAAGAVWASEPGGQGRRPATPHCPSELAPPSVPALPNGGWAYRAGYSNTAIFYRGGDLSFPPPLVDLQGIEESLEKISFSSSQLVEESRNARQDAISAFWFQTIQPLSDRTGLAEVEVLRQRVAVLTQKLEDLGGRVDKMEDLKELSRNLHALVAAMDAREAQISNVLQSVQKHGEHQEMMASLSLGQTAEIDPRGFFARAFGKTLYAVGPLVPSIMEGQLKGVTSDAEREALVSLLAEMRQDPPCPENEFRERIRNGLEAKLKAEKGEDLHSKLDKLMKDLAPSLLKACALPRY